MHLSSGARDEEPLVDTWVNRGRCKILALWDSGQLLGIDTARGVLDGEVGTAKAN